MFYILKVDSANLDIFVTVWSVQPFRRRKSWWSMLTSRRHRLES